MSRFLVTDQFQLILVEPDNRKLGWAIVRFVGLLQVILKFNKIKMLNKLNSYNILKIFKDTQVTGDVTDIRALHIIVEDVKSRTQKQSKPLLNAKFVFDDHIRCMAAKQRLCKVKNSFLLNLIIGSKKLSYF